MEKLKDFIQVSEITELKNSAQARERVGFDDFLLKVNDVPYFPVSYSGLSGLWV